jgi:anti-repressor protein
MTDLIRVSYESDRPTVSGRELHEFLEVDTPYRLWFPRMVEYDFSDGVDYTPYNFVHHEIPVAAVDG